MSQNVHGAAAAEQSQQPIAALHRSIYQSLDKYLDSALEILSSWADWLAEHERCVLDGEVAMLQSHAAAAADLHSDLAELGERRTQLLASARSAGLICATLKELAQLLPQWHSQADFRMRIRNVERNLAALRRLNTSAWILVNQCSRTVNETLLLMTSGSAISGAYIETPHADMCGGQILDSEV